MNKQLIGENAGIIWKLLNNGQRWEYDELKKASGLEERDFYAAIGWLAREDKIHFETDYQQHELLYLCLNVYY